MMDTPKDGWDVVIVDAIGKLGEHGYPLREELVRRGLRVKLNILPEMRISAIPADVFNDTTQTAYCVALLLMQVETSDRLGVLVETAGYLCAPVSRMPGGMPSFAPGETVAPDRYVEVGRLPGDFSGLADRIAARVRPLSN